MELDTVIIKISGSYYPQLTFIINGNQEIKYEFWDYFKNLKTLTNLGATLQKEPISKPLFFKLEIDYYDAEFKVSPLPPMDWIVLSIPIYQGTKKYRFNRLTFCENLRIAILDFMKEMNMDFLGNPKLKVEDYDKVWEIIGNKWLE